jgi:hypothetical protein
MSWLSAFFRKDSVKAILKMGVAILKLLVGRAAENLQEIAREEVEKAERSGKSGSDKYEAAFKGVKARFPQMKEAFINHAIETAVLALLAAKK